MLFELGPKRRRDLVSMLDHGISLVPNHCKAIAPSEQEPHQIGAELAALGAGAACHVVGGTLDGTDLPLEDALKALVARGNGFFISCIPGRHGYYEAEHPGSRHLLYRAP